MIFAESSHIFHFNTHSFTNQVTKKPRTHTHTQQHHLHNSTDNADKLEYNPRSFYLFHNRLVLALSVGVQFLWHGKIGMFLPYKNKCVECFSLHFHNV